MWNSLGRRNDYFRESVERKIGNRQAFTTGEGESFILVAYPELLNVDGKVN